MNNNQGNQKFGDTQQRGAQGGAGKIKSGQNVASHSSTCCACSVRHCRLCRRLFRAAPGSVSHKIPPSLPGLPRPRWVTRLLCGCGAGALAPTASDVPLPNLAGMAGFARPSVSAARLTGPRALAISALRMGGSNVPRVPYKAPGEQGYQVPAPGHHARACLFCPRGACGAGCTRGPFPDV